MLIDQNLKTIIADFGCAAVCRTEGEKCIDFDSSILVGSREYNAPEINMAKRYNGEKADLFSMGVILFVVTLGKMPFGKATIDDPYFNLLAVKEKHVYWSVFSGVPISAEFKDMFERLTEVVPEKRIGLSELKEHPWVIGPTYSASEISSLLRDQLENYCKLSRRRMQEVQGKHKCTVGVMKHNGGLDCLIHEKLIHDTRMVNYCAECVAINAQLDKKAEAMVEQHSSSDDQISLSSDESPHSMEDILRTSHGKYR